MPNQAPQLTVEIIEEQPLPIAAVAIEQPLQATFELHRPAKLLAAAVELLITNDERMQSLNRTYRGVDKTTDVLSLPTAIDSQQGLVLPTSNQPTHLGTIVISLPQAERQIGHFGETLESELVGLARHGLRHLLGHDHNDAGEWLNGGE